MFVEMKDIRNKAQELVTEFNAITNSFDVKWLPKIDAVRVVFFINSSVTQSEFVIAQHKLSQPFFELMKSQNPDHQNKRRLIGMNTDVPGVHVDVQLHWLNHNE